LAAYMPPLIRMREKARPHLARVYKPAMLLTRPAGVIWRSYYYAGSARIAMREDSDHGSEVYYILTDHLGSTSVAFTFDENDQVDFISRQWYTPWGETRSGSSVTATDYAFTGQRTHSLGMLWYSSRFYDTNLGGFNQPDNLVPDPLNPLDWNRYQYTRSNPINNIDPSGHVPWYIRGWKDDYLQTQVGNTCAVVSIAVSFSILTGHRYTQQDFQPYFPYTTWHIPAMNLPFISPIPETDGVGVLPWFQVKTVNALEVYQSGLAGYKAKATHGTRQDLMKNLRNGIPTIVTIALTPENGYGHALVVVGFDPDIGELIFFNPAHGATEYEWEILQDRQYNPGFIYPTFDDLWAAENVFIQGGNNMVTIQKPSFAGGGGGFLAEMHNIDFLR